MKTLYPPQEALVASMARSLLQGDGRAILNASATGTGKTVMAVELARRMKRPLFVVCPKAVVPSWKAEMDDRGVRGDAVNYELLKARSEFGAFTTGKRAWQWDHRRVPVGSLFVFDEVHRCKSTDSQNAVLLRDTRSPSVYCSATPFDSPLECRAIGTRFGLFSWRGFWNWSARHGCRQNRWGGFEFIRDKDAPLYIASIVRDLRGRGQWFRLSRDDLREFFPPDGQLVADPIDFGDDVRDTYAQMEEELAAVPSAGADDLAVTAMLRARQKVELLKVPFALEATLDLVGEGWRVVLMANFRQTVEALQARLHELRPAILWGGMSQSQREVAQNAFNSGATPVLLSIVQAGGEGINLHDTVGDSPRAIILFPSFSAKECEQAIGRIDRAGAKSCIFQRILFASGTVEDRVYHTMMQKQMALQSARQDCKVPEGDRPHSEFSPSSLALREKCPCYRSDGGTNPAAEMGTRLHAACEAFDASGIEDPVHREWAEDALAYVAEVTAGADEHLVEARVEVIDQWGYLDGLAVRGKSAILYDYKFGKHEVEDAETNLQMQAYAIGVFNARPEIQTVEAHIIQPPLGQVSSAVFDRDRLPGLESRVRAVIANARAGAWRQASLEPGSPCRYCAVKGTCPAWSAIASGVGGTVLPPDEATSSALEVLRRKAPIFSDPEYGNAARLVAGAMRRWCDKVGSEVLKAAIEGVEFPDFRLIESSLRQRVESVAEVWDRVSKLGLEGVSLEGFLATCGVSLSDFEKWFKSLVPRGRKDTAWEEFMDSLRHDGVIQKPGVYHKLISRKSPDEEDDGEDSGGKPAAAKKRGGRKAAP